MDELQPLKESRVAIIESSKDTFDDFSTTASEKKESAKKLLFENNSADRYIEQLKKKSAVYSTPVSTSTSNKIEFEVAKTFFTEEPLTEIKKEVLPEKAVEAIVEKNFETEIESQEETKILDWTKKEEKTENVKEIQTFKRLKPKINLKSRFKILFFGFAAVLTCFLGWSIYNAIEIDVLRAQLEQAHKAYAVNITTYISSLSRSDDLKIYSQDLTTIIPVQPTAEEKPVEYTIQSNWFDRLCDWLAGISK